MSLYPMLVAVAVVFSALADDQRESSHAIPNPRDYPATRTFTGMPAKPVLRSHRAFRTRIRQAAARGPNFAGHFTIAYWGCGSACVSMAVINSITGEVYAAPFSILGFGQNVTYVDGSGPAKQSFAPLRYSLDSRLLAVYGCPEDDKCGAYYYEWMPPRFRVIKSVPASRAGSRRNE
jgi:hypothetical protein